MFFESLYYVMLHLIWSFDSTYFKWVVNISKLFENSKSSVFRGYRNEILSDIGLRTP